MEPLEMVDHIESVLGLRAAPVSWPVGEPGDFRGVVDRRTGAFHKFTRVAHGASIAPEAILDAEGAAAEGEAWERARDELGLLDAVGADLDLDAFARGECTPVFFGSAVSNFGVGLLLDALVERAPAPAPRLDEDGVPRPSTPASPPSCSRSRRTWTRGTATASRTCACARAGSSAA
jgi:peptide chain release factor 3